MMLHARVIYDFLEQISQRVMTEDCKTVKEALDGEAYKRCGPSMTSSPSWKKRHEYGIR